jgi:lactoylglutathione lyase
MSFQTGHIGLNVTDLDRSKNFYREVFGFDVLGESQDKDRRYAFLGSGSRIVLTLWKQSTNRFAVDTPGLHHLSFQVESLEEVKKAEKKLQTLEVPFLYEGIVAHSEGSKSGGIFFKDPDGIRLEIYCGTGMETYQPATASAPSCGFF